MFEQMSYETILESALSRIEEDIDISEGSLIYTAISPIAWELAEVYILLDEIYNNSFADTASIEYLIRRAAERGVHLYQATHAILRGVFNCEIPIGSRFSLGELNYTAIEKIQQNEYKMKCETAGKIGNTRLGDITTIGYIDELEKAQLTELLIPAREEEEVEEFRQRYFESLDSQAFGGNIADYKEKVNTIAGVGGVKVYPTWNGGGTVKLVLIDSDYSKPSQTLIEEVQTIIDPAENSGEGVGIAPIGHKVTVIGCNITVINIQSHIILKNGYDWSEAKIRIEENIKKYFKDISKEWENTDSITIRISQIENCILNTNGVEDVSDTALNNNTQNIILLSEDIPMKGELLNV